MRVEILADAAAVARRAAALIAALAREAVAQRGLFSLALSGGTTPRLMYRFLAGEDLPWSRLHLFQVDERLAPSGHPDRNLTHVSAELLALIPLPVGNLHALPVEAADLGAAAAQYAAELRGVAGNPAVLDLVHLGLGDDGHTASLVPGDPALEVVSADVTLTGAYQGRRRMTLTYPVLDRARCILWVVTGAGKAPALARLRRGDQTIPAGRVRRDRALVLADEAVAAAGSRAGGGELLPVGVRRNEGAGLIPHDRCGLRGNTRHGAVPPDVRVRYGVQGNGRYGAVHSDTHGSS